MIGSKPRRWFMVQKDSRKISVGEGEEFDLAPESVHLVITSPPYWELKDYGFDDQIGFGQSPQDYMKDLKRILIKKMARAMAPGGIMCVNIGDVYSSASGMFMKWPFGSWLEREFFNSDQWVPLPSILWKKITSTRSNAFLGSGMLPVNAYVTNDIEHILLFRKGNKREFDGEEKMRRKSSEFTKDQRDIWYSQLWDDIPGIGSRGAQQAAWPREIPYRLIRMFSIEGDVVVDPFCGSGIGPIVAAELGRCGIGFDRKDWDKDQALTGTYVPKRYLFKINGRVIAL